MLTNLSIKNLTLVNHLELEFKAGMSTITGETGAGKSILLDGLGLALGDRADSTLITRGQDKAEINANFDLSENPEALSWLRLKALNSGSDCILRRVITTDGRSRAFINGSSVTLSELRDLSEILVDIHSQHEHHRLLKRETHRRLLDEYGSLIETTKALGELHARQVRIKREVEALRSNTLESTARFQLLTYQSEELNTLALKEGELEALESEQKRLDTADESRSTLIEAIRLGDKENETSASAQTSKALMLVNGIESEELLTSREMLESALIQIDEAIDDIKKNLDLFEANPERHNQIKTRLEAIYDIARKHRINPEALSDLAVMIEAELNTLSNIDTKIAEMENQLIRAESDYNQLANVLSASRKKTAKSLQSAITEQLQALGMTGAKFEISINRSEKSRFGVDDIEFRVATIPSSETGSLARIASGGELSRISLAIQVVTAKTSNTPTLVFDEVDVGIGGGTAEVVGALLRKLGKQTQVICVTHLPQVAAQANEHYVVVKDTSGEAASTTVLQLAKEEKVSEIARMLGGLEKTEESFAHAQAMMSSKNH